MAFMTVFVLGLIVGYFFGFFLSRLG